MITPLKISIRGNVSNLHKYNFSFIKFIYLFYITQGDTGFTGPTGTQGFTGPQGTQ
jgi:hypothetical protein